MPPNGAGAAPWSIAGMSEPIGSAQAGAAADLQKEWLALVHPHDEPAALVLFDKIQDNYKQMLCGV
jgi:hypothetical protein